MNPLYNAGIGIYRQLARLASLKSPKVRHMLSGQAETLDRIATFKALMAPDGFDVWLHAASLGEFEQGRPIIEALLKHRPDTKILLSFFSPSGYEVRRDFNPRVAVVYLPFDLPGIVKPFLDAAQPKMAIFVKYEFWGNYLAELSKRNIPTYIISAIFRPGQIFFRPWGCWFRDMLGHFRHLYVQDERSRRLLGTLGVKNVTVAGDTRFDRVTAIRAAGKKIEPVEIFKAAKPGAFTLVVGSSWEKDEDVYVDRLKELKNCRAIIAPHEFDKDRLAAMRRRLGSNRTMLFSDFARMCAGKPNDAAKVATGLDYLIIDCFGLLSSLYAYADAAYVGGGFGTGIHNINEPAVYGIPVMFGPKNDKFVEAAELQAAGAAVCISSAEDFARAMDTFVNNDKARAAAGKAAADYIASKIGATDIIVKDLFDIDLTSNPSK